VEEDIADGGTDDVKTYMLQYLHLWSKNQGSTSIARTPPLTRSDVAAVSREKGQQAHGGPVVIPPLEDDVGVL
jgi:hypothetical protein